MVKSVLEIIQNNKCKLWNFLKCPSWGGRTLSEKKNIIWIHLREFCHVFSGHSLEITFFSLSPVWRYMDLYCQIFVSKSENDYIFLCEIEWLLPESSSKIYAPYSNHQKQTLWGLYKSQHLSFHSDWILGCGGFHVSVRATAGYLRWLWCFKGHVDVGHGCAVRTVRTSKVSLGVFQSEGMGYLQDIEKRTPKQTTFLKKKHEPCDHV